MKSEMLLATLPTGETVLGKLAKTTDDKPHHIPIEPLRYGNERAANEKVEKIREDMKAQGKGIGVVRCEGRYMIMVYNLGRTPSQRAYSRHQRFPIRATFLLRAVDC